MQEEKKSTSLEGIIYLVAGAIFFLIALVCFRIPSISTFLAGTCIVVTSIGVLYGIKELGRGGAYPVFGLLFFAMALSISIANILLTFAPISLHGYNVTSIRKSEFFSNTSSQNNILTFLNNIKYSLNLTSREAFHLIEIVNSTAKCSNTKCLLLHIYSLAKELKQLKLWNKTCLDYANTLLQYLKCVAK